MKTSRSQIKATNKYNTKVYDQLAIRIPKGKRDVYKEYADRKGESLAGLIVRLLENEMVSDPTGSKPVTPTEPETPDRSHQDVTGTSSQ